MFIYSQISDPTTETKCHGDNDKSICIKSYDAWGLKANAENENEYEKEL